ncbi:MAG: hypothetical protein H6684_03855 [Deltaproteobacteria bacterium]|nr:hypothetical protein [bacterium]MCB9487847.1 hypothetical protein [Deltaproteobacteria bacterium]
MKNLGRVLGVLLLVLGASDVAFAGAWTQGQFNSYHKLSAAYYASAQEYDDSGHVVPSTGEKYYQDISYTYYGEFGLLDPVDLSLSLPYKTAYVNDEERTAEFGGIGDVEGGLKLRLYQSEAAGVFAIQGKYKYSGFYDENDLALPPGQGQDDIEGRLLYGRSLWPYGYVGLEAGYRVRFDEPSDEYKYLVEYGISFDPVSLRVKLDGSESAKNADDTFQGAQVDPTSGLEASYGKVEFAVGVHLVGPLSVEGAAATSVYGKQTSYGHTYTGAVVLQFK